MKNDNKNWVTIFLIIIFIMLIIAAGIIIYNSIKQYQQEYASDETTIETEQTKYNGKIYSKQEIEKNSELDEQIQELAMELNMTGDMINYDMGYSEFAENSGDNKSMTEEEKKGISQRYYENRQEIIKKIKELVNQLE